MPGTHGRQRWHHRQRRRAWPHAHATRRQVDAARNDRGAGQGARSSATRRVKIWSAQSTFWPHPMPTSCRGKPSMSMAANTCSERAARETIMTDLFNGFDLKGLPISNRIVMSAMTRTRATEDDVPTDVMRDYYVQRASAGLIVTECTQISDQAHGIIRAPGLHRADQIAAWRGITDAVHAAGGRIYCQIWHCGRVAHPDMRGGEHPVGPSPIPATGELFLPSGRVEFPMPRERALDEIPGIVVDFAQATRNAREAGFDGVELHGANGYLQDQFLQDG